MSEVSKVEYLKRAADRIRLRDEDAASYLDEAVDALATAQAEADALRNALHDAICMIGHAMPMDTTVLAGRRLVALEVWQTGYDLLNPKPKKEGV